MLGDSTKDFPKVHDWVSANLSLVSEIESFYTQRAAIELEYADKLAKLTATSFSKLSNIASTVSVGANPVVTPGSLQSASVVAWKEVLLQTENISNEKKSFAKSLQSTIISPLNNLQSKYASINDRWNTFYKDLTTQRDKNYNVMHTNKKQYDQACQAMESQRSKSNSNPAKLTKRENEMHIAKNNYLISINVSNRLKDKYYYQDIPELIDGLENLNQLKISKLNSILLSCSSLEIACMDKISTHINSIDSVIKQNLPTLDIQMFLNHNLANWNEPTDFSYIPSSIWHDDQSMVINPATLPDLRIKFNNSCNTYQSLISKCNDEKQLIEELSLESSNLLNDTLSNVIIKPLKDYENLENLLNNSITQMIKFLNDDTLKVIAEVEIESIQNVTEGVDMSVTEPIHQEKKIFGFIKKHIDVPVNTTSITETDFNKISITASNPKSRLFTSLNKLVDIYNTPVGGTFPSNSTSIAVALYDYQAQGDDEISISKNDQLSILESDDGSGWTYVSINGNDGLVPTSYIKVEQVTKKTPPPIVKPRKNLTTAAASNSTKRMKIIYDYQSQGDDELNLQKGDVVNIINKDDGSGWTEGEFNGIIGLFPTSYGVLE